MATRPATMECRNMACENNCTTKTVSLTANEKHVKQLLRELKVQRRLQHENILKLLECETEITIPRIVLTYPYFPASLADILKHCSVQLTRRHICWFVCQMLRGVDYIHSANVVHGKLNPSNMMIDEQCNLKICDFGSAHIAGTEFVHPEYVRTNHYVAPEVILGSSTHMKASDLWSIGCVLAEMLRGGRVLFPGRSSVDQLNVIINVLGTPLSLGFIGSSAARKYVKSLASKSKQPWTETVGGDVDAKEIEILDKLLTFNANERASAEEALQLAFVADFHSFDDRIECPQPFCSLTDDLEFKHWKLGPLREAVLPETTQ